MHADPEELEKVGQRGRAPEHHKDDDDGDHGFEYIHLRMTFRTSREMGRELRASAK